MKILLCLFGAATLLCAAEVSGKWVGTSEFTNQAGQIRKGPILMTLTQSGEDVTGTAGPSADRQQGIQNGKVRGDQLTFEIPDSTGKVVVELTVGDNSLRGEAKFHREYGVITMKLALQRE